MKKPMMTVPVHDGSLFTWRNNSGVIDRSDISGPLMSVVWSDSCDLGFKIVSNRTGAVVLFLLRSAPEQWDENEDKPMVFESTCGKFTVSVFNDLQRSHNSSAN